MALLTILKYPDPKLHRVAAPVKGVDDEIRALVDDMLATMYEAEGIGLAATQVDVHQRVIVIDTSEQRDRPLCGPKVACVSSRAASVAVGGPPGNAGGAAGATKSCAPLATMKVPRTSPPGLLAVSLCFYLS